MKADFFIDTSGFYSLLAKQDQMHKQAKSILKKASEKQATFVTTDYVIDETVTLLHARGPTHIIDNFFDTVSESKACRLEWMDQDRFLMTRKFFLKHSDHSWSFTDCFSFLVMKEFRLSQALTKDNHFKEAGYLPLLKK